MEVLMAEKNQTSMARTGIAQDPFAVLRRMTSELDRVFDDWPSFKWPAFEGRSLEPVSWSPKIEVVEKDNRLVTRVDLPGVKKEDVTVEVTEGCLTLSGERTRETEEKKDNYYRSEREYGSFCRTVPLPDGVKGEEVKASFADGVLEVSVPLPAKPEARTTRVKIEEPRTSVKSAA
jgi:HSP20 family protein